MTISNTKRVFLGLMLVAATATSAGCAFFPFGHGPHGGGGEAHSGGPAGNHGGNSGHGGSHGGGNGQHQEQRP